MAWFRRHKDAQEPPVQVEGEVKTVKTEGLFAKCPGCEHTLFKRDFDENLSVCPDCGHHLRIGAIERLQLLFDDGTYEETDAGISSVDPLHFVDTKGYEERLRGMEKRTGLKDAVVTAVGTMGGRRTVVASMELEFVGGSMGSVVGEKIARAVERSIAERAPLVIVSASGGARMQEGTLSLMQMAKISGALARLDEARIPYISVLTDPTTGGVTASFAMLGDVNIAEPGALIGFAGPRVIEQTIRQKLPKGFQRAEFLLEHGMLDDVVPRTELRDYIIRALALLHHE
ncbi:MAG TPA: acetyl-CoA carboxylase, carboxyltransferase subunit beta [Blastocatellia bacterium]|nr:acetyl-CoA carboxylase, carboxyltransferase subunit beta [Blastocatellia bacterium]